MQDLPYHRIQLGGGVVTHTKGRAEYSYVPVRKFGMHS